MIINVISYGLNNLKFLFEYNIIKCKSVTWIVKEKFEAPVFFHSVRSGGVGGGGKLSESKRGVI